MHEKRGFILIKHVKHERSPKEVTTHFACIFTDKIEMLAR